MLTARSPTTVSAAATGRGERGDCAVVGRGVGTVVGGVVVITAVVETGVVVAGAAACTVNVFIPINPAASAK